MSSNNFLYRADEVVKYLCCLTVAILYSTSPNAFKKSIKGFGNEIIFIESDLKKRQKLLLTFLKRLLNEQKMSDFTQQLLSLLAGTESNTVVEFESTFNQQTIPNEGWSSIIIQQWKEVERKIKKVLPQLDFTYEDFCSGEQVKLINKLQLLPAMPLNVVKLEYHTIRNATCLIATAQRNLKIPLRDMLIYHL